MLSWMQLARKIEGASRTSEKARLFADALRVADEVDLEVICRLLGSRGTAQAGAVSWPALAKAVEEVAGAPAGSLAKILDETGDIGLAVEELLESERPIAGEAAANEERHAQVRSSAIASATGVLPVAGAGSAPTLRSLPESFAAIRGASGQRRHDLLMQLFYGTSPIAAKYIVRMLSGDVQIGLRDGLLESAIAAAFGAEVSAVRWAMTLEGDAGRVALLAKRGALLHDIGKVLTHEHEGTHVQLGVDVATKYGENPLVVNCIAAHHDDVPHESEVSVLVQAGDSISGSRPGARREAFETYVKRLEGLEKIASSYRGVERVFAIQAGREIRVVVTPEQVDDTRMTALSEEIARRIESELQYPGQIKVVVIRESRAVDFAR